VALFIALGGSSYAALTITGSDVRNGTLTSADVKDSTLEGRDVKTGALSASDIKNGSLLATDFKAGELPAGPAGPAGPTGPAGPAGPAGPSGATNVVTRRTDRLVLNNTAEQATVNCAPGETLVGGGAGFTGAQIDDRAVFFSEPRETDGSIPEHDDVASGWAAAGLNKSGLPQTLNVMALCASP
jgi:hypothetical protein